MITHPDPSLISKYDIAAPRYTSYPTVPYWTAAQMAPEAWSLQVRQAAAKDSAISVYIHLPFCESLCTYCGCNKHITKNHAVEKPYLDAVLAEWTMYRAMLPDDVVLHELHLGGGTPTFFHPEALARLLKTIFSTIKVDDAADMGFEAHPWSASAAHLQTLYDLGFRRISIGVQDFDEHLMQVVHRSQTIHSVVECTENARRIGYTSINYDLIYGLPFQTPEHILIDAAYVAQLKPDRIAFYSYAHVPWLKKSQNAYSEADLPAGAAKRLLYETGRTAFEQLAYQDIGMDHFALPDDALALAYKAGTLHRNFMGYTTSRTRLMIGLGASAIGDTWDAFAQNEKEVAAYQNAVKSGRLPVFRGHFLSEEDQLLRGHILRLMTCYATFWDQQHPALEAAVARLEPLLADGLVTTTSMGVKVTETGQPYLRNICMAFDAQYWRKQPEGKLFSQAV